MPEEAGSVRIIARQVVADLGDQQGDRRVNAYTAMLSRLDPSLPFSTWEMQQAKIHDAGKGPPRKRESITAPLHLG